MTIGLDPFRAFRRHRQRWIHSAAHLTYPGADCNDTRGQGGDACQVHAPGAVLDEEQHIQAALEYGVDVEEVRGEDRLRLGLKECARQVCPDRLGAGSMPASLRICHTVDGASLYPSPASSP